MDRPADTAALLRFLITEMDDDLESGRARVAPPVLLRLDGVDVACAVGGIDLRVKPLEGHPAEVLRGFIAPPEWFAVGVLTGGWAHAPDTESVRVRVTTLLCRDGTALDAVRPVGGDLRFMDGCGTGAVPDTLRRVLGLPTDPPDVTITEWLAKCWLMVIAKGAKRGKREPKLSWPDAAALHPTLDADEIATMTWERFRQLQAERGSEDAAWMDDGMFARWMVHSHPPITELLPRAARRLTPSAAAAVESTLRGWGLLDDPRVRRRC